GEHDVVPTTVDGGHVGSGTDDHDVVIRDHQVLVVGSRADAEGRAVRGRVDRRLDAGEGRGPVGGYVAGRTAVGSGIGGVGVRPGVGIRLGVCVGAGVRSRRVLVDHA